MEVEKQKLLSGVQNLNLKVKAADAGMPHPNVAISVATYNPAIWVALQAHRVHQAPVFVHLQGGHPEGVVVECHDGHGTEAPLQ